MNRTFVEAFSVVMLNMASGWFALVIIFPHSLFNLPLTLRYLVFGVVFFWLAVKIKEL